MNAMAGSLSTLNLSLPVPVAESHPVPTNAHAKPQVWTVFAVWFAAFVVGGVFSIVHMAVGRAGRRSKIPFGPWMLAGAWIGLVVGERVWAAYTGTF